MAAYGVHMATHREMFSSAALATRTSALSETPVVDRSEATFILAA